MAINLELAARQGLTEDEVRAIEVVHKHLDLFLARPTFYVKEEDCPDIVRAYEFVLQSLWKFPMDSKFHRYEFELAGCNCPILDNMEMVGHTNSRYYSSSCKYHGSLVMNRDTIYVFHSGAWVFAADYHSPTHKHLGGYQEFVIGLGFNTKEINEMVSTYPQDLWNDED